MTVTCFAPVPIQGSCAWCWPPFPGQRPSKDVGLAPSRHPWNAARGSFHRCIFLVRSREGCGSQNPKKGASTPSRFPCHWRFPHQKRSTELGKSKFPKWVTKAQGMYRVLFNTKGAEVLSQVVKAAAEWVTRKPPLGKEDPSVSPWKSLSAGRHAWSPSRKRSRMKGYTCASNVTILDYPTLVWYGLMGFPQTPWKNTSN